MNREDFIKAVGINTEFDFNGLHFNVLSTDITHSLCNVYEFNEFRKIDMNEVIPKIVTISIDIQYEPIKEKR